MTSRIDLFFKSFQVRDYRTMAECYLIDAVFMDEVFDLRGREIGAMWHMLCERGQDLCVTYRILNAVGSKVHAVWSATYTFSGKKVENHIRTEFVMKDGKIKAHRDRFDMWRWCRQALGWRGILFGWIPVVQQGIRKKARASLNGFLRSHPEYTM